MLWGRPAGAAVAPAVAGSAAAGVHQVQQGGGSKGAAQGVKAYAAASELLGSINPPAPAARHSHAAANASRPATDANSHAGTNKSVGRIKPHAPASDLLGARIPPQQGAGGAVGGGGGGSSGGAAATVGSGLACVGRGHALGGGRNAETSRDLEDNRSEGESEEDLPAPAPAAPLSVQSVGAIAALSATPGCVCLVEP